MGWDPRKCEWTVCKAKVVGTHGCVHSAHIQGLSESAREAITHEVAVYRSESPSPRLAKKLGEVAKRPSELEDNDEDKDDGKDLTTFGEIGEVSANVDLILGRADYKNMPYAREDVDFVEVRGVDRNHGQWDLKIHTDGTIEGPYAGETSRVDLEALREQSDAIHGAIIEKMKITRKMEKNRRDRKTTAQARDAVSQSLKAEGKDVRTAANTAVGKISSILSIPDGRPIKSMGEKADVKIGLKSRTSDHVDRVSTKTFIDGGHAQLFSANGSRAGEIRLISMVPEDLKHDPARLQEVVMNANGKYSSDMDRSEYLRRQGFTFDADSAIIMNADYERSIEKVGKLFKVDAKRGIIAAAVARVNDESTLKDQGIVRKNAAGFRRPPAGSKMYGRSSAPHLTDPMDMQDDLRKGFLAVCWMRGSTEYNPSEGVYDPDSAEIVTYAEVRAGQDDDRSFTVKTTVEHRSRKQEIQWLADHGSIESSNNGRRINGSPSSLSPVHLDGDVITLPVNLGFALRSNHRAKRGTMDDHDE